jgi:hypothetical protein
LRSSRTVISAMPKRITGETTGQRTSRTSLRLESITCERSGTVWRKPSFTPIRARISGRSNRLRARARPT